MGLILGGKDKGENVNFNYHDRSLKKREIKGFSAVIWLFFPKVLCYGKMFPGRLMEKEAELHDETRQMDNKTCLFY